MLIDYLHLSILMMRAKPVRAFLSLLGIYIGVMALVLILSIREGVRRQIDNAYRTQGAQIIFVHPGYNQATMQVGHLTLNDLQELRETRGVLSVQPRFSIDMDARTLLGATRAHVSGIDENFLSVFRVPLVRGRNLIRQEVLARQPVCLVTAEMASTLFPSSEPLGASVSMQGVSYQVIGVMDWNTTVGLRTSLREVDILIPVTWMMDQPDAFVPMLEVRMNPDMEARDALRTVRRALTHGDTQREAFFYVRSMQEFIHKNEESNDRTLQSLLAIAGISLLVGGIGVANVMVTTVTERTREIGLRKALGARRQDILFQFVVESSVLSGIGGLLAAATGTVIVTVLHALPAVHFPLALTPSALASCVLLTFAIGVLAGVYPASRAAALSPAEALRYE